MSNGETWGVFEKEVAPQSLDAATTALVGDLMLAILRGEPLLSKLLDEVPGLATEARPTYVRLILAACNAEQRGEKIGKVSLGILSGVDTYTTAPRYIDRAIAAGHLVQTDHPTDKRAFEMRPTAHAMEMYVRDMNALTRIITKIGKMEGDDAAALRQAVNDLGKEE